MVCTHLLYRRLVQYHDLSFCGSICCFTCCESGSEQFRNKCLVSTTGSLVSTAPPVGRSRLSGSAESEQSKKPACLHRNTEPELHKGWKTAEEELSCWHECGQVRPWHRKHAVRKLSCCGLCLPQATHAQALFQCGPCCRPLAQPNIPLVLLGLAPPARHLLWKVSPQASLESFES